MRIAAILPIVLLMRANACGEEVDPGERTTPVGVAGQIDDLVLPGSELEAAPLSDRDSPLVVRVLEAYPHGTAHRYSLAYHGLEAGSYNLVDFLRRIDGSDAADVPPVVVDIVSVLPQGQVEPHPLPSRAAPRWGGYGGLLIAGGILWAGGLIALLRIGRQRRVAREEARQPPPQSLADRLRPIVLAAVAGEVDTEQRAQLERILIAHWRTRLGLDGVTAAEALVAIRNHDEAGQLIRQLEAWLHCPSPPESVDVAKFLAPYQSSPSA